MYYSAIGLLAVLILLIENQDVLMNLGGAFEKPAWRAYRRFLFAVLTYYVTDILWGILESRRLAALLFADTTVYFIAMATGVVLWAEYTVAYLDEDSGFGRFLVYAGRFIAGFITLLVVINIFAPVLFTVDSAGAYRVLPFRYVILALQIILLLMISVYAVASYARYPSDKRLKYRTLALFGLIMGTFLFVQLWFPYLPLYAIGYMLGTCLLHTVVVNDEKAEYRRASEEAGRVKALNDTISSMLDNMPGMTFTKDAATGVYLACNQAFAEFAKKESPAGVIGLTDAEIFDPARAAHFAEDSRRALSMDEPYIFFEDVQDEDGNPRQLQTTEIKYTDSAGRLCLLGMRQDVTDTVRIRREVATTRDAYEKARSAGIMYSHIAQSMTRGFRDLYYVNVDSEEYIEYRQDETGDALVEVRRGWHFFEQCQIEAEEYVFAEDRAALIQALDRKTLMAALDRNKTFVMTYRLNSDEGPVFVSMRVSRMEDDERYIVLGVTDVDEQMRLRRAAERVREEQIAYRRISALIGDFLCVYVVDPKGDRYREFSASASYEAYGISKAGMDFFNVFRDAARSINHAEDLNRFLTTFTRENVMSEIERHGIFTLSYRIMMEGKPLYVQLKAAMVAEKEGPRVVVGVNDIDAQVRQEESYVRHLAKAQMEANVDPLTGVKNRHAYLVAEERLNLQIAEQRAPEFAIAILDVNDLKKINDTEGHKAGDQYIRDACRIVCEIFRHSPVFRLGGDEFAVIAQGSDYANIESLIGRLNAHNAKAIQSGGIVIACGAAKRENDGSVALVFERADQNMYDNKIGLKARRGAEGRREKR